MRRKIPAIALALFAAPAEASDYVAEGHGWNLRCNPSGYVLTSTQPVSRIVGIGVESRAVRGIEKLYLGRSCDALHNRLGEGTWCWSNGGFIASFDSVEFRFGRQELICPGREPTLECGC